MKDSQYDVIYKEGRTIDRSQKEDDRLGPLSKLPGVWRNKPGLEGRGWNMIALPFFDDKSGLDYRLLLNRYNEELEFKTVDKGVPNRGLRRFGTSTTNLDQLLVTVDYEQEITQTEVVEFPVSNKASKNGLGIHHEPGLWLFALNEITDGFDIARLATIPHGNSVLALGRSDKFKGAPVVPAINGLPIGVNQDLDSPYLAPYKHFHENLFAGLFDPTRPVDLLRGTNEEVKDQIVQTTELHVNTQFSTGGIFNIPFIVAQADASDVESYFWIQELETPDGPKLRLQYLQIVMLDFFPRRDGLPGLIRWPHISINTMEKVCHEPKK